MSLLGIETQWSQPTVCEDDTKGLTKVYYVGPVRITSLSVNPSNEDLLNAAVETCFARAEEAGVTQVGIAVPTAAEYSSAPAIVCADSKDLLLNVDSSTCVEVDENKRAVTMDGAEGKNREAAA